MKNPPTTQPPAAGEAAHTPFKHLLPLKHDAWDCHDVTRETEIRTALGFTLSQFSGFFSEKDEHAKVREVEALHAFIVRACNSHAALVAALKRIQIKAECASVANPRVVHECFDEIEEIARAALALAKEGRT